MFPKAYYFKVSISLAWEKLNQYYTLTDDSPTYVAATVLHPRLKYTFIEKAWAHKKDWIDNAKRSVEDMWVTHYKRKALLEDIQKQVLAQSQEPGLAKKRKRSDTTGSDDLDDFLSNTIGIPQARPHQLEEGDELWEWLQNHDEGDQFCDNPLQYWIQNRLRWPHLAQMALDLFSIPAMSSSAERIFSLAGLLTPSNRARLSSDTIGASLCLKSWDTAGIVNLLE